MPVLSMAQRRMLANAIAGAPLAQGISCTTETGQRSTVQALHRKGMLAGIQHQPTEAGRAYFATPNQSPTK